MKITFALEIGDFD